jgi:hypothetical protein
MRKVNSKSKLSSVLQRGALAVLALVCAACGGAFGTANPTSPGKTSFVPSENSLWVLGTPGTPFQALVTDSAQSWTISGVVPESVVIVNNSPGPDATDPDGISFLDRMSGSADVNLRVEPSTLEDPMWTLENPGARLTPRAGHVAEVDFPVRISGEITGTIRRQAGSVSRPAEGMDLELIDASTGEFLERLH